MIKFKEEWVPPESRMFSYVSDCNTGVLYEYEDDSFLNLSHSIHLDTISERLKHIIACVALSEWTHYQNGCSGDMSSDPDDELHAEYMRSLDVIEEIQKWRDGKCEN